MSNEVTQADFDAAQKWWNGTDGLRLAEFQGLAEAFAKHRLASQSRSSDIEAALRPFAELDRRQAEMAEKLGFKDGNTAVRVPRAMLRAASAALKETPNVG